MRFWSSQVIACTLVWSVVSCSTPRPYTGGDAGGGNAVAGTLGHGGSPQSGGIQGTGGMPAGSGGSPDGGVDDTSGGASGSGGLPAVSTGGMTSAGGNSPLGAGGLSGGHAGGPATGGMAALGGAIGTGAMTATGGRTSTGGFSATGGGTATGGRGAATGGSSTGGTSGNGGGSGGAPVVCQGTATQCDGSKLQTCVGGQWGLAADCPAHESCVQKAGSAQCACSVDPVCRGTSDTCADPSTLATCMQDSHGCFYQVRTMPCGPHQTCSGDSCACQGGAALVCNDCLIWDFESGGTQNWALTSNNATGTLQLAAAAGRGQYSLSIANAQFNQGASSLGVQVSLCVGSGVAVPTNGFSFTADVLFQTAGGLAFGDDGTGSGFPAVVLEANGFSHIIAGGTGPLQTGTWMNITSTLVGVPSTTTVTLRFSPQSPWYGTIFVDNVSLK